MGIHLSGGCTDSDIVLDAYANIVKLGGDVISGIDVQAGFYGGTHVFLQHSWLTLVEAPTNIVHIQTDPMTYAVHVKTAVCLGGNIVFDIAV